jgi:ribosome-associated toxin RatA of RatAB toxin-antitoxin module
MDTCISYRVRADQPTVFQLAAAVEDWPRILPHYDWVRVLETDASGKRTLSMAARRDVVAGLGIPVRWTAVQSVDERAYRIEFEHVRGISRGMHVVWTLEPVDGELLVQIRHVFEPGWPLPAAVVQLIVGDYFVNGIARRTLRRIGELAEVHGAPGAGAGQRP